MRRKNQNGMTLVEVLVAIGVASLAIIALVKAVSLSVKSSNYSKMQSSASSLAQKLINDEIEKSQQPNLYPNFFKASAGTYLMSDDNNFCYRIKREIAALPSTTPDYAEAKMVKIIIEIYWEENGAGTLCNSKKYSRSRTFETYVTN